MLGREPLTRFPLFAFPVSVSSGLVPGHFIHFCLCFLQSRQLDPCFPSQCSFFFVPSYICAIVPLSASMSNSRPPGCIKRGLRPTGYEFDMLVFVSCGREAPRCFPGWRALKTQASLIPVHTPCHPTGLHQWWRGVRHLCGHVPNGRTGPQRHLVHSG